MAKLTTEVVQHLRREVAAGASIDSLAEQLGVGRITVYQAVTGATWGTVTDPAPIALRQRRRHVG